MSILQEIIKSGPNTIEVHHIVSVDLNTLMLACGLFGLTYMLCKIMKNVLT